MVEARKPDEPGRTDGSAIKEVEAVDSSLEKMEPATASFLQADTLRTGGKSTLQTAAANARERAAEKDIQNRKQKKPVDGHPGSDTPKQTMDSTSQGIADLIARALQMKQALAESEELTKRARARPSSEFAAVFHRNDACCGETFASAFGDQLMGCKAPDTIKVAAYIRVSTDTSDQENSYETQERYFT